MSTSFRFNSPSSGIYYHYTSRANAQEMSMTGSILPGSNGLFYLTDVLYRLGWQATDRLALPNQIAELAIPIHESAMIDAPQYIGLVPVVAYRPGRALRRGGGHQWTVQNPIPLSIFPWSWIELEKP